MSFQIHVGVSAMLIKDNHVLLLLRSQSIYGGGLFALPAGHIDGNEPIRHALARELFEEIGITIAPDQTEFVHVSHVNRDGREYISFFFLVPAWQGEPVNKEPKKHESLMWFNLNQLPKNMLMSSAEGLKVYQEKRAFSELGWKHNP